MRRAFRSAMADCFRREGAALDCQHVEDAEAVITDPDRHGHERVDVPVSDGDSRTGARTRVPSGRKLVESGYLREHGTILEEGQPRALQPHEGMRLGSGRAQSHLADAVGGGDGQAGAGRVAHPRDAAVGSRERARRLFDDRGQDVRRVEAEIEKLRRARHGLENARAILESADELGKSQRQGGALGEGANREGVRVGEGVLPSRLQVEDADDPIIED